MDPFGEVLEVPKPFFLGVLGSHEGATQERIEEIMILLLQCFEHIPQRIILPSEGRNNMYISDWADRHKIITQIYDADWHRHNRRARIFRDTRIMKESTHFLIFLNKRSEGNEKLALRLSKQGKPVITVDYQTWMMESIEHVAPEPLALDPSPKARGSKRGTGKGQVLLSQETREDLGNQSQLTTLWAACKQEECR
jgi:hypothetical protein